MVRRLRDAGLVDWSPAVTSSSPTKGGARPSTSCAGTGSWRLFSTKWSASSCGRSTTRPSARTRAVSERLEERIDVMLGHPSPTPTATPSPPVDGRGHAESWSTGCSTCPRGRRCRSSGCPTRTLTRSCTWPSSGCAPGSRCRSNGSAPSTGRVGGVGGRDHALGRVLARVDLRARRVGRCPAVACSPRWAWPPAPWPSAPGGVWPAGPRRRRRRPTTTAPAARPGRRSRSLAAHGSLGTVGTGRPRPQRLRPARDPHRLRRWRGVQGPSGRTVREYEFVAATRRSRSRRACSSTRGPTTGGCRARRSGRPKATAS